MSSAEQPIISAPIEIAVLDDDVDFRTYIEDFLVDEGLYAVRTYGHPDDLFLGAEQRLPDIVLLDMQMGPFKGAQVAEQLLQRWPNLCIIIITGYPSLEDMRATFKMKVFDYLAKPFSLAQLRQTLRNAAETFGLGQDGAGPYPRASRSPDQNAAGGARLVAQGSCGVDPLERVADQFHRARRESSQHGVAARHLPRLRQEALRDPGLDRLLKF